MPSQAVPDKGVEVRLASRPRGWPTRENFDVVETPVTAPAANQVLVRNTFMSVDPYMRGRMNDARSYVPPFQIGKPLTGHAVGEVIASESERVPAGQAVVHPLGWREYATLDAEHAVPVSADVAPLSTYLGVLGVPGLTAYVGLFHKADFQQGDAVFVSAAAGAVGSLAGQLAKLSGASRVVGSAGSTEKVRHLTDDLGFDAAFNYKDGPVSEQLAAAAPDGIDVYFDNVGGDHLEAAIDSLHNHGRIAACGAVSVYNAAEAGPGPRNLPQIIKRRLSMRGFIARDHDDLRQEFVAKVAPWIREGRIRYRETTVDGIRNAPDAFLGMLRGENTGKMLVRL